MSPIIGWSESVPSGTSLVGQEPTHAKSLWTALSTALGTYLFWDGSGGGSAASRGELRPGASRSYFAAASKSSSAATATSLARAFFASDTSRLFVYESAGTYLAGTPFCIEHATPATQYLYVQQSGETFVSSTGTPTSLAVTWPAAFVGLPDMVSLHVSELSFLYGLKAGTFDTGFLSWFSFTGPGVQSSFTLRYSAVGLMGPQV
jgi:hypothetical protein